MSYENNNREDNRPWMRNPRSYKDEPEDFIEPKYDREVKREDSNREYFDSRHDRRRDYDRARDYDRDRDFKNRHYNDRKRPPAEEVVQEEKTFFCGVCDHTSYSLESYNDHVVSVPHINRAARVFHFDLPTKPNPVKQETVDNQTVHHCEICDVKTNGDICWQSHLSGAKHKKKEKQWLQEKEMALAAGKKINAGDPVKITNTSGPLPVQTQHEFQSYAEPLIGLSFITEIQIPGEPISFCCEVCDDEKFANNLKFSHLTGMKHRMAVIRKLDTEWAKQIVKDCGKNSELSLRLAKAAAKLEKEEGRQLIKSRLETIHGTVLRRSGDVPVPPGPPGIKNEFLPQMKGVQETLKARLMKRNQAYQDMNPSTMEFSGLPPPGIGSTNKTFRKRSRSASGSSGSDRQRSKSPNKSRSTSRKRKDSASSISSVNSRQRKDSANMDVAKKAKVNDNDKKSRSTSVSSRAIEKKKSRARKMSSSSSSSSSSGSSSSSSSSSDDDSDENKTKKKPVRRSRPSTPPPPAPAGEPKKSDSGAAPAMPRVLDADTKKMVMQNLTELAKCCVTNEADAELALQVSNALTQALLQYRMRNMPAEVLQTIQAATPTTATGPLLPAVPPVPTPPVSNAAKAAPPPPVPSVPAAMPASSQSSMDMPQNFLPPGISYTQLTAMATVGPPPPRPAGFPVSGPPLFPPVPLPGHGIPQIPPGIATSQTRLPIVPNHLPPPHPRPAAPYINTMVTNHVNSSSYEPPRPSPGVTSSISGQDSDFSSPPRSRDIAKPRTPPLPRSPSSDRTPPRIRPPQRGLPPQVPRQRQNNTPRSSQESGYDTRSLNSQDAIQDSPSSLLNGPNGSPYGDSL